MDLKRRSSWISVGPKTNDKPWKRREGQNRHGEKATCMQPPEAEKEKKDSPLEPLAGAWPCRHLDCELLASQAEREYISTVLSHSVYGNLLQ